MDDLVKCVVDTGVPGEDEEPRTHVLLGGWGACEAGSYLSWYIEVYSVIYDSGSVPELSNFSLRGTSPPESIKAHRLLCNSNPGLRVIKKKREVDRASHLVDAIRISKSIVTLKLLSQPSTRFL